MKGVKLTAVLRHCERVFRENTRWREETRVGERIFFMRLVDNQHALGTSQRI